MRTRSLVWILLMENTYKPDLRPFKYFHLGKGQICGFRERLNAISLAKA